MTSWIEEALEEQRTQDAELQVSRRLLGRALGEAAEDEDRNLQFVAHAMELAVLDLIDTGAPPESVREASMRAFQLLRVMPRAEDPLRAADQCLRLSCYGVIGDRGTDVARLLTERPWPGLPTESEHWRVRTLSTVFEVWLRLIRKTGWEDLDEVQRHVVALREQQTDYEADYLDSQSTTAQGAAWELIALYHLARAAELLALYTTQGHVEQRYDIREQLDAQFDRALTACDRAELMELRNSTRLLSATARQLVDNCIWTVTRAVNSRVTDFVREMVSRERSRPIFEMLPPQRRALREEGLLGSGHRSIVVNLPTSSGKTFIAEFRILQALNQFDRERGWVAYLAPTRALVNQICSRLRRDFTPLGINVERVSPALEIDALEAGLLTDGEESSAFRVLVTTPEKLDLLLRGGWEESIGRPLTLVVVDEAHNLQQGERGLKLELMLATINRECQYAQFLLLTPFISNASDIAQWLAPDSHQAIELQVDWQPNDRAIVLSVPQQRAGQGQFTIDLATVHTTRHTLTVPEVLSLSTERVLDLSWSGVRNNASKLAAATAQRMKARGPVIVLCSRPDWAWSLAGNFKHPSNVRSVSEETQLVQRHLAKEFGDDFELCELLQYGVGVHHAGLSDEARGLMEWLLESGHIDILVATTTIAQGVNFPISNVVFAQNKYYDPDERMIEMPPEDFWNIAGRAGRVDQASVGMIALAAPTPGKEAELTTFVGRSVLALNSTLVGMIQEVVQVGGQLELHLLFHKPEWSAFLQYLAHTYRQIGDANRFASEVEQVMRGTLGFQNLRRTNGDWANQLIAGILAYAERIAGKPLSLVDSTGFSWESVSTTLSRLAAERVTRATWDPDQLFGSDGRSLQKLMGILLDIPELRENLKAATGGRGPDGDLLARMVRSWVDGTSLPDMAREYYSRDAYDKEIPFTKALTNCCRNVYGKLTQTASWGIAALQSLNIGDAFDDMSDSEQQTIRNLPARVFYGVNTDQAIALRMLGVPRGAAPALAQELGDQTLSVPLSGLRNELARPDTDVWVRTMGDAGADYLQVWRILEGIR